MPERGQSARAAWWRGRRGEWYVVVQGALLALIALGPRRWPGAASWAFPWSLVATVAGVALMITGALLAVAGLRSLGPALTALPYPTENGLMVESGPYAFVRHPIYSGLVLGAAGWGLVMHGGVTLAYAIALFVLFDVKSRREERWLREQFPGYDEYRTRVKRLIPWVY